jgi:hypothetical protein
MKRSVEPAVAFAVVLAVPAIAASARGSDTLSVGPSLSERTAQRGRTQPRY